MSITREQACAALLTLVSGCYAWASTPARRLKLWTDVAPAAQPALFQFEGGTDPYTWIGTQAKRTINVKMFAYFQASDDSPGATTLNAIVQAIDTVMLPPPGFSKQTLGLGIGIDNARIKGIPLKEPGDLDGQGILIIEIEVILP
jgi:hypothetical protein